MRILPVIDLKDGTVVRGIAGQRSQYAPIESKLTAESSPRGIAKALVDSFGATDVYVADLNAIAGTLPDWHSYDEIAKAGLNLWIDAGTGTVEKVDALWRGRAGELSSHRLIVGLESLASWEDLKQIADLVDTSRLVFSLDMKAGVPLVAVDSWAELSAWQIATFAHEVGVRQMIVLDLADVGTCRGVSTLKLCRKIHHELEGMQVIAGGGVRTADDLQLLANAGVDIALVASALHQGSIRSLNVM